jgi:tRNA threonylcarbamoyladenosine biosynthesis protein TsaE
VKPFETSTEDETVKLGARLGAELQPGDVVLLYGELGTGKTAFVRGLAEGIGAAPDEVSSPTFTLVQEYTGKRGTLYHVDLYRLEPREVQDLGLEELVSTHGIVAIEWAERWEGRPEDAIEVWIDEAGEEKRSIRVNRPVSGL